MILSRGHGAFRFSLLPVCCRRSLRGRPAIMADDATVSQETLTSSLTLLVNFNKVLLQNAKQEAEGKTHFIDYLTVFRCFLSKKVTQHVGKVLLSGMNCFGLQRISAYVICIYALIMLYVV